MVYLDQLTSCKVKSLLCHEVNHDAATIGSDECGGLFLAQFDVVPGFAGRWPPREATELHASWTVMRM